MALVLAFLSAVGVYRAYRMGAFHRAVPFQEAGWGRVPVPAGAEDLAVAPGSGALVVSAGGGGGLGNGGLLLWRPGEEAPVKVRLDFDGPFRPHGIDCWRMDDGALRVFAVNHRGPGERGVEIFDIDEKAEPPAGGHVATIRDRRLTFPNDVAAAGGRSFFVTNNPRHDSLAARLRLALGWWSGQVFYYDGGDWTTVDEGIPFPNGILLSGDGEHLYVAETLGGAVRVYQRPARRGRLEPRGRVYLGRGLDNIAAGPGGALWVAAHPDLPALGAHRRDPRKPSPWRLYRLRRDEGGWRSEVIFSGDGSLMPGVSVGLPWEGQIILGGVVDPALKVSPVLFSLFPDFSGIFMGPR